MAFVLLAQRGLERNDGALDECPRFNPVHPMASLELDPSSGRYRVRFRFEGREYKRSLRTKHLRRGEATLGQVEETIRLLQLGIADVPSKVDAGDFIVSGARTRREQRPQSPVRTLADLFRIYQSRLLNMGAVKISSAAQLQSMHTIPRLGNHYVWIRL